MKIIVLIFAGFVGGLFGWIISTKGITMDTWQFWAALTCFCEIEIIGALFND